MARSKIMEDPESDSGITARLKHLRDKRFDGNNSRMARDLGISHPVISRVLSGEQSPPGKLLEALAQVEGLNLRWLFAGEGEPFSDRGLGEGGGHFCPIARELLPGDPKSHPEYMTQTSLAVATAFYSPTAYWFAIPKGHPILTESGSTFVVGDYLLIETATQWTRRLPAFKGRLCVFTTSGRPERILAQVESANFGDLLPLDLKPFWPHGKAKLLLNEENHGTKGRSRPETTASYELYLNELVGVCRLLCRLDPLMEV